MKNNRCKQRGNKWIPQSRFKFLWFIPTPLWIGYWYEYGGSIFSNTFRPLYFNNQDDCIHWLKDKGMKL